MIIRNATIYTPERVIEQGVLVVENGRFVSLSPTPVSVPPAADLFDAAGLLLLPGFIDLQLNGAFGSDFTEDPASIWPVAHKLPRYGVTSFLPTMITAPLAVSRAAQRVLQAGPPAGWGGATPLGLHVEGPFLNPARKGAHNPAYLRLPSATDVRDWSRETGVWLVTLAPELPGATAVIRELQTRGVVVSAGHSEAAFAEAQAGFAAGIRYGTHLFNAMSGIHHRQPGLVGALLADACVTIGLIPDGIHVHPALVRLVWQLAGSRLNLVTDGMAALGTVPGTYQLGDFTVTVDEKSARLPDGTLAGSILALDEALRNLITFTDCTLAAALSTVTKTPATLLGLARQKGRIAPGYDADFVLATPDLRVVQTFVGGKKVYDEADVAR